jgi:CelD/BcsL family acetyltransferase involved in cellulose biosynthesis
MGVISSLEAGGRLLAAHFGLRRGPILHYWFPVYDPALARYGPGRLLLAAIIEAAPLHGISRIERGVGTTQAKRDFANAEVTYGRGLLLAGGLRSTLTRSLLAAHWRWQYWSPPAYRASYHATSRSEPEQCEPARAESIPLGS